MKKRIITIIFLVIILFTFGFCCSKITHNFTGTLEENDFSITADMSIEYSRFNRWFHNKNSYGSVVIDSDKELIKYELIGTFQELETVWTVDVVGYNRNTNSMEPGKLYFDEDMNNIVLKGKDIIFLAADDEFINNMNSILSIE